MNKNVLLYAGIGIIIIVSVLGYQIVTSQNKKEPMPAASPNEAEITKTQSSPAGSDQKMITLDEVAKHSTAEDCWMVIEDKVYDTTPYIQKQIHPGGAAILFGCGKDATAIFNLRPKDNKPHSDKARGQLPEYYIGELAK